MKKYSLAAVLLFFLLQVGCEKDYLVPKKVEIDYPVSFANDIIPIFTTECSMASCHDNGGAPPNLMADKAYDELLGLGYVDTIDAKSSILYVRMISTTKPMPPAGLLPAEQIALVLAWIEQGALNN